MNPNPVWHSAFPSIAPILIYIRIFSSFHPINNHRALEHAFYFTIAHFMLIFTEARLNTAHFFPACRPLNAYTQRDDARAHVTHMVLIFSSHVIYTHR